MIARMGSRTCSGEDEARKGTRTTSKEGRGGGERMMGKWVKRRQ